MNERIKKLAEQAGFGSAWFMQSAPGYPALPKEGMLKDFAELIIKECLHLCYYNGMNDELYSGQLKAAEYIKEHFGVKNAAEVVGKSLYAHPTPAVVRLPLTDGEIDSLQLPESVTGTIRDFVRVVERAHGIGGKGEINEKSDNHDQG